MSFEYAEDYFFQYLDTQGKVIIDGGCGLGSTTLFLCHRALAEGNKIKIIAIDNDPEDIEYATERIRNSNCRDLVEFILCDLADMSIISDTSVDQIYLNGTLCWLESSPLKSLKMLKEIHRVLKKDGKLSIMEQMPQTPDMLSAWESIWAIQKILRHIQGKDHLVEVWPQNVLSALELIGFISLECKEFPGEDVDIQQIRGFADKLIKSAKDMDRSVGVSVEMLVERVYSMGLPNLSPSSYVIHASRC